jgi:DNA-binding MarR family transcriptional regulator
MTTPRTLNGQDIGQAEHATRAILNALLAGSATTFHQWVALRVLANAESAPEATASRLSVAQDAFVAQIVIGLKIDESIARATIDELVELSWVTTSDVEPALVALTDAGRAHYDQMNARLSATTERLYGDLPTDDLVTAQRVLAIVTERANAVLASSSAT